MFDQLGIFFEKDSKARRRALLIRSNFSICACSKSIVTSVHSIVIIWTFVPSIYKIDHIVGTFRSCHWGTWTSCHIFSFSIMCLFINRVFSILLTMFLYHEFSVLSWFFNEKSFCVVDLHKFSIDTKLSKGVHTRFVWHECMCTHNGRMDISNHICIFMRYA